jgi:hypothetical protein
VLSLRVLCGLEASAVNALCEELTLAEFAGITQGRFFRQTPGEVWRWKTEISEAGSAQGLSRARGKALTLVSDQLVFQHQTSSSGDVKAYSAA